VTGSICLNGQAVLGSASTGRLLAYCEQADHHYPLSTVREAIEFSAHMRLSSDVSDEQRHAFVQRVLIDLELSRVAGRLVSSLAPGELKRLTIGVELAANSPVIFLGQNNHMHTEHAAVGQSVECLVWFSVWFLPAHFCCCLILSLPLFSLCQMSPRPVWTLVLPWW